MLKADFSASVALVLLAPKPVRLGMYKWAGTAALNFREDILMSRM